MRRVTRKIRRLRPARLPLGNRLTVSRSGAGPLPVGVTTNTYNAANELVLSQPPTGQPTTITYDPNRNMLLENAGGSLTTWTWDFENRPTSIAYPSGSILTNTYAADNKRRSKSTSSGTTNFVYDGNLLLMEVSPTLAVNAHYYGWGASSQNPQIIFQQYRGSVSSYYAPDASRNIRYLMNSAGAVTDTFIYDASGNALNGAQPTVNPFNFAGQGGPYSDGNFLFNMWWRVYLSDYARFPSWDPLWPEGGLNPYEYVGNNPVNWADPTGLSGTPGPCGHPGPCRCGPPGGPDPAPGWSCVHTDKKTGWCDCCASTTMTYGSGCHIAASIPAVCCGTPRPNPNSDCWTYCLAYLGELSGSDTSEPLNSQMIYSCCLELYPGFEYACSTYADDWCNGHPSICQSLPLPVNPT